MLFLAALFAAIAVIVFLVEFVRPGALTGVINLAFASFAGSFLCFILDILHAQGKI